MNLVSLDFEYNRPKEPHPNLVSCALSYKGFKKVYWLHKNKTAQRELVNDILNIPKPFKLMAYAVTAEARCFLALALNPLEFEWIDLYLEYRQLLNHNTNLAYGRQLKKGKIVYTKPPKHKFDKSQEDEDDEDNSKPEYSLSAACFKLLKKKIDTERKDRVRDIIIAAPVEFTPEEKLEILEYNESDIDLLEELLVAMVGQYRTLLAKFPEYIKLLPSEMTVRANYAARTAIMEHTGYPINVESTKNFSLQVRDILNQCQGEINNLFPLIQPFNWDKKEYKFKMDTKAIRSWIDTTPYAKSWMQTDGGKKGIKQHSLKKDAFTRFFNPRHEYKENSFGEQIVRFLNLKQNLNGFMPGGENSFWDYVGTDGRVRAYFGIYGAQSARSQPKATGFLFLKSSWMRCLCEAPKGTAIAGIDYKSQEALIAALQSRDENMIAAYQSGDPYFYLAKLSGKVPKDGLRKDYELERSVFKIVWLALQYGMKAASLAREISQKLEIKCSKEQAQQYIDMFNKSFIKHYLWKQRELALYRKNKFIKLPCGWYMWGDNLNENSTGNVLTQGFGASIMRKAVEYAQDMGLTVIKTLHDAIYIQYDSYDYKQIDLLGVAMDKAFRFYFPGDQKLLASVGLEANTWSLDYKGVKDTHTPGGLELKVQEKYLDKRGAKEYAKFEKYFTTPEFLT